MNLQKHQERLRRMRAGLSLIHTELEVDSPEYADDIYKIYALDSLRKARDQVAFCVWKLDKLRKKKVNK